MKTRHNHGLRKGYRVQYKNKAGEVKNGTILNICTTTNYFKGEKQVYTNFTFGENAKVFSAYGEKIHCRQGQESTIVLGPATA